MVRLIFIVVGGFGPVQHCLGAVPPPELLVPRCSVASMSSGFGSVYSIMRNQAVRQPPALCMLVQVPSEKCPLYNCLQHVSMIQYIVQYRV